MANLPLQPDDEATLLPGTTRICDFAMQGAASIGLAIGLSNLLVWLWQPAQEFVGEWEIMVMRANTAACITAASLSLLFWETASRRGWAARVAQALGLIPMLFGGGTTVEYLAGVKLGIDQLFIPGTFPGDVAGLHVVHPGRMSFNASVSLCFLGAALTALDWSFHGRAGRRRFPSPTLAMIAALPAGCGLAGYILGTGGFTGLLRSTNILLHAALAQVVLAAGVLLARPERRPIRSVFVPGAAGVLLRWLLPGSTVLLLALAWAIGQGQQTGFVTNDEGAALMLYGGLLLLFFLIGAASRAVARQEATALQANVAWREQERRSNAIIDASLDGVLLMDIEGRIVHWNKAAERIFGWSADEMVGKSLAEHIIPEPYRDVHHRGLQQFVETGAGPVLGKRLELSALRRNGEEFPAELSINLLPGGGPQLFVGFVRNIADRKSAEQALRGSEQRFRVLADNISQLAWMTDETGSVVWYNQRWFDYTGTTLETAKGWGWQKVHHPDHVERVVEKIRGCFERGEDWEDVFPMRGRDGLFRWFLSRAMPIRDEAGKVLNWFGTNTDVTEQLELSDQLTRAKERAEEASSAKDTFLAALSHELRTPLTPVLLSAAALRDDQRLPDDVRAELAMIERNISLEGRLIDDLLDLTRVVRGKLRVRMERCDAHSLLGHAVDIVKDDADAKQVTLDLRLRARRPGLTGDPARLQQVFWNLLKNAVKFTPPGGRVTVTTRDVADLTQRFILEVRDTGVGFEPAVAERLFEPFEQAGREGDHRFGGLGLGLTIVRAIVDLHGGSIRAVSGGSERGATFILELPGATEPPSGLALIDPPGKASIDHRLRLLLVEDHEPTLGVLSRLLRKAGHEVITAGSVRAGLASDLNSFDVLVSDLGLPDGTGLDLIVKLRALKPNLRGIALSGYGMEEDLQRSREAGFATHLVKPIDFSQLTQALEELGVRG